MSLLSFHDLSLSFARPVLREVGFHLEKGEKVALLGPNGSGKTSLFGLVLQNLQPDRGTLSFQPELRMACLGQRPPASNYSGTLSGLLGENLALLSPDLRALQPCEQEPWVLEKSYDSMLAGLGLSGEMSWGSCSLGQRRRALLARVLAGDPDLILLDEPTNHLDLPAILFLEAHLTRISSAVILISHDRSLVGRVANRIWEIDLARLVDWRCGYEAFLARREAEREAQAREQERFEKKLSEEEAWLRQGIKARRTRNEGRVRALEALRREASERLRRPPSAQISLQDAARSGVQVLDLQGLSWSTPQGQSLVNGFTTRVQRGDRIGIIGPNGCGKSTLLNLLLGDLVPDAGQVVLGTQVQICRMKQLRNQLDEEARVMDVVADGADRVLFEGRTLHITAYLGRFLFTPEKTRTRVSLLSGGEKARLLMARLFLAPANLLVLDEPTNDLDLETLEILEDLLGSYAGTLLLVSHDRSFLNNLCSVIWSFEGGGRIGVYAGGYDQAMRAREALETRVALPPEKRSAAPPQRERPRKLTYLETRRLEALPAELEALEARRKEILERLADPGLYGGAPGEAVSLNQKLQDTEAALEEAMEVWVTLEAIREAQEGGRG